MKYTNLLEKLFNLFMIIKTSWINLLFLAFFIIILILLCTKKISKSKAFLLSLMGDILLIVYTVSNHYEKVTKLIDSIINRLFIDIYFPSIYVYLFVLIFINVITIGSLLNIRKNGIYKTVNGICFLITNFILALILDILSKNNIDVFKKSSIFSNTDLVILLEISIGIFIIWLLSLTVIYLTNMITERILLSKKAPNEAPILNNQLQVEIDFREEENTYREQDLNNKSKPEEVVSIIEQEDKTIKTFIPEFPKTTTEYINPQLLIEQQLKNGITQNQTFISQNNQEIIERELPKANTIQYKSSIPAETVNSFDLSSFIPKKQENKIITPTNNVFEQILNNTLPIIEEKKVSNPLEEEKNTYTLNDYRIFNKILKDIKEHNQNNTINIDKMLEYRLITKYSSETYDLFKRMLKNYSN